MLAIIVSGVGKVSHVCEVNATAVERIQPQRLNHLYPGTAEADAVNKDAAIAKKSRLIMPATPRQRRCASDPMN